LLRRFLVRAALLAAVIAGACVSAAPAQAAGRFVRLGAAAFTELPLNDWPTYQYDVQRDGFNPNSAAISPASVPGLHLAWVSPSYDFNTGTQPILIAGAGTHKGLLVYGGGSGNLYAFDALTGQAVWKRQVGYTQFNCGGDAQYGVGGTAAYDPVEHVLYAASTINHGENSPAYVYVYKLNPLTGAVLAVTPINPLLSGQLDFTHAGLTLSPNGLLYVGISSSCDIQSWRGSLIAVNTATMKVARAFYPVFERKDQASPGPYSGGGVWGWGGASLDGDDDVYVGVGNADINQKPAGSPFAAAPTEHVGYGDHIVQLSPDLSTVIASNVPANITFNGNSQDLDFSGTPVIASPLQCSPRTASMGKAGGLYIYNAFSIGSGPIGHFQLGVSAYYATSFATVGYSPITGLYYAPVASSLAPSIEPPGMLAISPCSARMVWHAAFGPDAYQGTAGGYPRSAPTVTAGGLLLSGTSCNPDARGGCAGTGSNVGGAVWLEDAVTGTVLNAGLPLVRTPNDVRMAPVVDGDWVYVVDNGGYLYGYTIDPSYKSVPPPPPTIPANRRSLIRWREGR
jgi:hypothetical protein